VFAGSLIHRYVLHVTVALRSPGYVHYGCYARRATERAMLSALGTGRVAVHRLPRWSDFKLLFTAWKDRIRSRYELEQLNERDLADMGLTRSDTFNEIQKPFWQA
jgi:uncharacterized protein YjiS (DUF1127 family)